MRPFRNPKKYGNHSAAPHLGVCAYLVRFALLTYRESESTLTLRLPESYGYEFRVICCLC